MSSILQRTLLCLEGAYTIKGQCESMGFDGYVFLIKSLVDIMAGYNSG